MKIGGRVVHHSEVPFVLIKVVQFKRLVGKAEPKALVNVGLQRLHGAQQDDVPNVELDSGVNVLSMKENRALDILLGDLRTGHRQASDKINVIRNVTV